MNSATGSGIGIVLWGRGSLWQWLRKGLFQKRHPRTRQESLETRKHNTFVDPNAPCGTVEQHAGGAAVAGLHCLMPGGSPN